MPNHVVCLCSTLVGIICPQNLGKAKALVTLAAMAPLVVPLFDLISIVEPLLSNLISKIGMYSPDPCPRICPRPKMKAIISFSALTCPAVGHDLLGPGKILILALKSKICTQVSP